jgi:histone acetyltransferase (RNA polymerase elongator complex component)
MRPTRARKDLDAEQLENETQATQCRIIGVTIETRPDTITPQELRHFRRIGCTRVQLGLQHTSDAVLKKVNRGHTVQVG